MFRYVMLPVSQLSRLDSLDLPAAASCLGVLGQFRSPLLSIARYLPHRGAWAHLHKRNLRASSAVIPRGWRAADTPWSWLALSGIASCSSIAVDYSLVNRQPRQREQSSSQDATANRWPQAALRARAAVAPVQLSKQWPRATAPISAPGRASCGKESMQCSTSWR